jgi:hypothetical protein
MSDKIISYDGQTITLPEFARKQFNAFAFDCLTEKEGPPLTDIQRLQLREAYCLWLGRKQLEWRTSIHSIGKYELYALLTETRYELNHSNCLGLFGVRKTTKLLRILNQGQV